MTTAYMRSSPQVCYIGLGSNLNTEWGDSRAILGNAVAELAKLGDIRVSRLYSSPPMGPQDQPDYLNAVVALVTTLEPLVLLDELQRIENQSGRIRVRHWGERTLDLDLLLYAEQHIQHPRLTVPHAGLLQRDFVILPLLDVASAHVVASYQLDRLDCIKQPTASVIADAQWYDTI